MTPRPAQPTPGSGPPDSTQRMFRIADLHHVFDFEILDAARIRGQAQDGVLRLGVQDEARRVGLRIATNDQNAMPISARAARVFWDVVDLPMPPLP